MDELKPMLNLKCIQVSLGYGDVLYIDLGDLVEYEHPLLNGSFHGTWQIGSRTGMWRIYDENGLIAGDYDEEPILAKAFDRLDNRQLLSVEVSKHSSDAKLRFSESMVVEFLEASSEEANWEVIGPGVSISFGPGPSTTISAVDETELGLSSEETSLDSHSEECAKRWETVIPQQAEPECSCRECAFYAPLRGRWYFGDYGLCTNPLSPFDGKVTKVGSGCAKYASDLI